MLNVNLVVQSTEKKTINERNRPTKGGLAIVILVPLSLNNINNVNTKL